VSCGNALHFLAELVASDASRLMSVYAHQNPRVADFNMSVSVLYEITKPSTPETTRQEIVERLEAGES
jgi:hypothetical protein